VSKGKKSKIQIIPLEIGPGKPSLGHLQWQGKEDNPSRKTTDDSLKNVRADQEDPTAFMISNNEHCC